MKERNKPSILLVNPPFYRFINLIFRHNPLGLRYIAAVLEQNDFPAHVWNFDFPWGHVSGEPPLPPYSEHIGKDYEQELENPHHPVWKEVDEVLEKYSPTILGISMMTPQFNAAVKIAQKAKERNPDTVVVVGGFHPTALPTETLKEDSLDIVVSGEGEYTMLDLVKTLAEGKNPKSVQGIYFKENGQIISNAPRPSIPDLDALPYPWREFLTSEEMNFMKERASILTSRGCPYNCTFCARSVMWSHKVRFRSAESVADEIEYLYREFGCRYFMFEDDTWIIDIKRANKICDLILERKLDITWECQTRVNLVTEEMLKKLKSAGCIRINIGVEAGNQAILDSVKKRITLPQIRKAAKLIKDVGIELRSFFIVGYPQETKETVEDTKRVMKELDSDYNHIYLLVPLPGSELFDQVSKENKLLTRDWFYYYFQNPNVFRRDYMSNEELYHHFVDLKNFIDETRRARSKGRIRDTKYIYHKIKDNIRSPRSMLQLSRSFVKLLLEKK